jgi:hypothetical protein
MAFNTENTEKPENTEKCKLITNLEKPYHLQPVPCYLIR